MSPAPIIRPVRAGSKRNIFGRLRFVGPTRLLADNLKSCSALPSWGGNGKLSLGCLVTRLPS